MTAIDSTRHGLKAVESDRWAITLRHSSLRNRTFLLGDQGGFVLYLPVEENTREGTLLPIKWFGASEFGRKYLEANVVWVEIDGKRVMLNRTNQTEFVQYLDRAERVFSVDGCTIRQCFFVPTQERAFVMTLDADQPVTFVIEPEFDMRYYQAFNTDFSRYEAQVVTHPDGDSLQVGNCIEGKEFGHLNFYCSIRAGADQVRMELLPEAERRRTRTYCQDEQRAELIESAYALTHEHVPDEAPIWDAYQTTIYVPAALTGRGPLALVYAFDDIAGRAEEAARRVARDLDRYRRIKDEDLQRRLQEAICLTGNDAVDRAYTQVLTRFNDALVARDVTISTGGYDLRHWYAIFAGNKYFLDAWKRDENISLEALLQTDDYDTMRAILDETWQFQDPRTGRLPHIIRLGEPLVYYSSDGTLWALLRLFQYTQASGDISLLNAKYSMVEHFFRASLSFVQRGLLPSGGIIDKSYLWETWEDTPYTPRDGYPVEIELLWLTALDRYLPFVRERTPSLASTLEGVLAEGRKTFTLFYQDGYLADSLSYTWTPRTELTPNGYIAFAVNYPLPPALRRSMVLLARQQLAGQCGIRSLAPRDWARVLSPAFLQNPQFVGPDGMESVGIYNYHRGIEWLWLNQFFVQGELQCGDTEHAYTRYVAGLANRAVDSGGVGGLGELYDRHGPLGADFQAWSMASFIDSLHAFGGVHIDALHRTLQVRPSIPHSWPYLTMRRRAGETPFDLHYQVHGHRRHITLAALHSPPNYTVRMGVRVPPGATVHAITLDETAVPAERWQHEPGCTPEAPSTVWIETAWRPTMAADFFLREEH